MRILIETRLFCVYMVLWPVYDVRMDEMESPCFRVRLGSWLWPKRK